MISALFPTKGKYTPTGKYIGCRQKLPFTSPLQSCMHLLGVQAQHMSAIPQLSWIFAGQSKLFKMCLHTGHTLLLMNISSMYEEINGLSESHGTDLSNKIECNFFQAAIISILLYVCITWTLTKNIEKKLGGNYTSILQAILNKSWKQHPTKQQPYDYLPPISKTIQIRQTRHVGHCWRSKDDLLHNVLLWTPSHEWEGIGQPARTYLQQHCIDTRCSLEDLPEAMENRGKWKESAQIPSRWGNNGIFC